jgi:hypothetical protein
MSLAGEGIFLGEGAWERRRHDSRRKESAGLSILDIGSCAAIYHGGGELVVWKCEGRVGCKKERVEQGAEQRGEQRAEQRGEEKMYNIAVTAMV